MSKRREQEFIFGYRLWYEKLHNKHISDINKHRKKIDEELKK